MAVLRHLAIAVTLAALATGVMPGRPVAATLSEYELKAAFLVNFAKFVEWPASAFASPSAPVTLGVVGDDPFGSDLDDATRGKLIGIRPMVVKRVDWRDDLSRFHIVFVSVSELWRYKDILRSLDSSTALTVSDIKGFGTDGGIITFVDDNNRIRFAVNGAAAQRRGLKISSKLLSLATVVH
jgi:hypothetical protein